MCVVPMAYPSFGIYLVCKILVNEHYVQGFCLNNFPRSVKIKSDDSDHLWMTYISSHVFSCEYGRAVLDQIDENGFIQMELRFGWAIDGRGFHQVGVRVVYKQDMKTSEKCYQFNPATTLASLLTRVWMFITIQQKESN